jgi:transmembrane sensor
MYKERIWTLMSRKLSGEATNAELTELNELIKIHPDTDIPVQFVNEFWAIPAEADTDFLEATFHLHTERLKEKGFDLDAGKQETGSLNLNLTEQRDKDKRKKIFWIGGLAALVVAIIFIGFFYNNTTAPAKDKIAKSEVSTKNGSRTKIQLPDGSTVWLNSSSKLVYDNEHFGTGIREVSLTGEAYFDVVKNPAKPFVIHTAKMDIKVLGTAFNVKCYPGEKTTETSLIHGSVEVTLKDRQEKIMMKPNEKLIINNDDVKQAAAPVKSIMASQKAAPLKERPIIELRNHLTLYPADNSIVETAWKENRLVFSSETLEEIALKMERWYGVTIIIASERLKKELLTGAFEEETIYQALDALQLTTPFTYKMDKNVITISK